jgi:hypothetical protein
MRILRICLLLVVTLISCKNQATLKNRTRPGGYAMGERISLQFSLAPSRNAPDSINVFIIERKTGYIYSTRAIRSGSDGSCEYSVIWDGRKPDGRWPTGGPYLVYARIAGRQNVYSDTVQIGLAD